MKIGIITFHFASNQGAALQCYALQTYLQAMGHEAEVINYRPPYHVVRYSAWKNPFLVARGNWRKNQNAALGKRSYIAARGFSRGVVASLKQTDKERYEIFRSFTSEFLHQTKEYKSLTQLQSDPPQMDVYVSGSDQLWNTDFLDYRFDGAYFLDFGSSEVKRITYAVSPKEHYSAEELFELKKLIKGLDAVCIREHNEDLASILEDDLTVAVDPTLLLDADAYAAIERKRLCKEPYLFVYGLENSQQLDSAVKTISAARNLKVINGTPHRTRLSVECEKVHQYGPREFLSYIRHADFVVTNSFHGTAFSVIYQRPFVVLTHSTRGKRMVELLGNLGISERIWRNGDCPWQNEIPYHAVQEQIAGLRTIAKHYFEDNL